VDRVEHLVGVAGDADGPGVGLLADDVRDAILVAVVRAGAVGEDEGDALEGDSGDAGEADGGVHVARDGSQFRREVTDVGEGALRVEVAGVEDVIGALDALADCVRDSRRSRWDVRVADDGDVHGRTLWRQSG
jgi:hypothetical protein